jgi:hypothetical protein
VELGSGARDDRPGKLKELARELGVNLAARLGRAPSRELEEERPLRLPGLRQPPSAAEVGERIVAGAPEDVRDDDVVQVVAGPDHAVAEAVGRDGELDRDERLLLGVVVVELDREAARGVLREPLADQRRAADERQELVRHHPLVVPADKAPGGVEERLARQSRRSRFCRLSARWSTTALWKARRPT